jgi:hypothetical protein
MARRFAFGLALSIGLLFPTMMLAQDIEPIPAPIPQDGSAFPEPPAAPGAGVPMRPRASAPTAPEPELPNVDIAPKSETSVVESYGGGTAAEPQAAAPEPTEKTSSAPVPQEYQIQTGDTLWDICQKLLDNPWYWPKLWALNQYIENPHLIYPGNRLRFFSGSETAPPRLDVVDSSDQGTGQEAPGIVAPKEAKKPVAEVTRQSEWEVPWEKVGSVKLKAITFISEKEVKEAGKITHSGEPKLNLTAGDKVYMQFVKGQSVSVGDRFFASEILRKVNDPDSWLGSLGYLVKNKATIRVTCIYPDTVEGLLIDSDDTVVRTDLLLPYKSPVRRFTPHSSNAKVEGRIIDTENQQFLISNNDFVFLNRGRKHGVDDGLKLAVVRRGDGLFPEDDRRLPFVTFGNLLVVDTNELTSTAYVVDLKDPLRVGDIVVSPEPTCRQGKGVACK